jgi:hypothetical protein
MKSIFTAGEGFLAPDGTIVYSVLDPAALRRVSGEWMEELSIALGEIPPHTSSKIHVHPVVTQATWLLSGELILRMKDDRASAPYTLELSPERAVVTQPGTFFQLVNQTSQACRVLYFVTPAFIFEVDAAGEVIYNDALVVQHDWDDLAEMDWLLPELGDWETLRSAREEAVARVRACSTA